MTDYSRQAGVLPDTKIATAPNVREWCEGLPVEIWVNGAGRLVVRASNECGNNYTEVDVLDLVGWLKNGGYVDYDNGRCALICVAE